MWMRADVGFEENPGGSMIPNDPNAATARLDRMSAKLDEKLEEVVGYRSDLHIGDFQRIDESNAKLQINYDPSLGEALSPDVTAFVLRTFEGALVPQMETAEQHGDAACVTLVVSKHMTKRPIEDIEKLTPIVADVMYIDQKLNDTWRVESLEDGTKYLMRQDEEDITAIVEERRRRMSAGIAQASYVNKLTASGGNIGVGDIIEFYAEGQTHKGMVVSVPGDRVKVRTQAGVSDISSEAVLRLLEKSKITQSATDEELRQYFRDAYGFEDYAEDLVEPKSM
jgi:hypothetical protein